MHNSIDRTVLDTALVGQRNVDLQSDGLVILMCVDVLNKVCRARSRLALEKAARHSAELSNDLTAQKPPDACTSVFQAQHVALIVDSRAELFVRLVVVLVADQFVLRARSWPPDPRQPLPGLPRRLHRV